MSGDLGQVDGDLGGGDANTDAVEDSATNEHAPAVAGDLNRRAS
jgi:hypothetical protein